MDIESASAASSAGLKATVAGGASAVFGEWGLSSDLVALGGIAVGVIGLVVQVVFKSLEYRLRLREHRKLMGRIE